MTIAHEVNTRRSANRIKKKGIRFVELDIREKHGALYVEHGIDEEFTGVLGTLTRFVEKAVSIGGQFMKSVTFEDYLAGFSDAFHFWVDLKSRNIEGDVLKLLESYQVKPPIMVSSGYYDSLKRLKDVAPQALVFLGNMSFYPTDPISLIESVSADGVSIHYSFVDEALIELIRNAGYLTAVWTGNRVDTASRLLKMGANIIISDKAEEMNRLLT